MTGCNDRAARFGAPAPAAYTVNRNLQPATQYVADAISTAVQSRSSALFGSAHVLGERTNFSADTTGCTRSAEASTTGSTQWSSAERAILTGSETEAARA